jgi:predicted lipoprotein with Yx(FWY)xxD motif
MRSPALRSPLLRSPGLILAAIVAGVLVGLVLTGHIGSSAAAPAPEPAAPAAAGHSGHGSGSGGPELWAVQSGPLGVVATDGAGHLLYRSDADSATPPTSRCTDACTATWKPMLLPSGQQFEALGVDKAKVGQLTRPDGSVQLTLAGWPLYYNESDSTGLADTGHNGQDGWSVITPTGAKAAGR